LTPTTCLQQNSGDSLFQEGTMSSQIQNDVWQVLVQGEIYEADTDTIKQWIAEGRILPNDKVKKGTLSWIEANRVPMLRLVFAGEEHPQRPQPLQPSLPPSSMTQSSMVQDSFSQDSYSMANVSAFQPVYNPGMPMPVAGAVCYYHHHLAPVYICRICSATFCKECPKFVGNAPLCKLCGDLCGPYEEVRQKSLNWADRNSGFGFDEFVRAIRYPLNDITTLVILSIIYSFFILGTRLGFGIAGPLSFLMGYTLIFACMSLTINRVSSGKMDGGFMPDFSESSFREIIIGPSLLGLAIMIVTAGPGLLLFFSLGYALLSGGVSFSGLSPASVMATGGIFLIIVLIGLLWGVFYYPMALIVAGFTQDFRSVVNPLVGLGAIKNMGLVYPKAFFMCLVIWVMGFVLKMAVSFMSKILYVPIVTDIFSIGAEGLITFYTNLVVACILGFSLYKCADQLGIVVE
jgi:hypothetical protein